MEVKRHVETKTETGMTDLHAKECQNGAGAITSIRLQGNLLLKSPSCVFHIVMSFNSAWWKGAAGDFFLIAGSRVTLPQWSNLSELQFPSVKWELVSPP